MKTSTMQPQIIVASHRRSGTHLTMDVIRHNFPDFNDSLPSDQVFLEQFRGERGKKRFRQARESVNHQSNIFFTHIHKLSEYEAYFKDDPELLKFIRRVINNSKIIYVYRDGRDAILSLYHWMIAIDWIAESTTFSSFLKSNNNWDIDVCDKNISRPLFWSNHVKNWIKQKDVLVLKYENFSTKFDECVYKISEHINLPMPNQIVNSRRKAFLGFIPYNKFLSKLHKHFINKHSKNKSQAHFFRKGKIGEYYSVYSQSDIEYFNSQVSEVFEDLNY